MCLAAAFLGVLAARRAGPRGARWALPAAVLLLGSLSARGAWIDARVVRERLASDVPRLVAEAIRRGGSNGRDVFVVSGQPVIYYLARAKPPSRYVLPAEFAEFAASSGAGGDELARILSARPNWIVDAEPARFPLPAPLAALASRALTQYAVAGRWTEPASHGRQVTLYRRR